MKNNHTNILIAAALILMATTARIINAELHLYNFVPVAALGLFAGAVVKDRKYAFALAIFSQLCADAYFEMFTSTQGFYGRSQIFVYLGLVAATSLGFLIKRVKFMNVLAGTLAASVAFFLLSNLGYYAEGWNGYAFGGLTKTYIDAIPFFKNSLIGDLAGSTLLFGGYYLLQQALGGKMVKAKA